MTSASTDTPDGRGEVLTDADDVRAWLADEVYAPSEDDPERGAVGLEVELFPFWTTGDGGPAARLALVEMVGIIDELAERDPDSGDGRPSWHRDEVLITEEPGAQLELAGPPDESAAAALDRVERLTRELAEAFDDAGAALVSAGLDLWSDPDQVPVQLEIPRYHAMNGYFDARGGRHGHLLMCASCSIQVNVDLGPPATARKRWLLANLASPVFTAVFAASPTPEAVNGRAMGWRGLDPTRTGVSPALVTGETDPVVHVLDDTLRADVMMVERDDDWVPGEPGWSFGDWVRDGHEEFGPPTNDDLRIHLTTLFPEARLRGFLEIRTLDALPGRWRGAAVELVTALFYDSVALEEATRALAPVRERLPALLRRAAEAGLGDPEIADLADQVMRVAGDAVTRRGHRQCDAAHEYLERYTLRGRSPSDELRELLDRDPSAAFGWARE
ncbi:MAG: glutamate-cysteine ligase family protein [Nitriliruptorales bacterium]|nr:glutamate-cysteine ligase family protein [Nitriliruptorales bacterium]